jgi:hypothetical protein
MKATPRRCGGIAGGLQGEGKVHGDAWPCTTVKGGARRAAGLARDGIISVNQPTRPVVYISIATNFVQLQGYSGDEQRGSEEWLRRLWRATMGRAVRPHVAEVSAVTWDAHRSSWATTTTPTCPPTSASSTLPTTTTTGSWRPISPSAVTCSSVPRSPEDRPPTCRASGTTSWHRPGTASTPPTSTWR